MLGFKEARESAFHRRGPLAARRDARLLAAKSGIGEIDFDLLRELRFVTIPILLVHMEGQALDRLDDLDPIDQVLDFLRQLLFCHRDSPLPLESAVAGPDGCGIAIGRPANGPAEGYESVAVFY